MPFSICIFRFDMTLKNTNVMRNTNQHKKVIYSASFSAFDAVEFDPRTSMLFTRCKQQGLVCSLHT